MQSIIEARCQSFSYDARVLDRLEFSLSRERLAAYKRLALGNRERTMRLYVWNTALSEALYGPIQGVEILVRNAFHREITKKFDQNWYEHRELKLGIHLQQMLIKAKEHLQKHCKLITASTLLPELSFGFWVGLLGRHHEPILKYDLINNYRTILEVASSICPDTARWIECHSHFYLAFHQKPE